MNNTITVEKPRVRQVKNVSEHFWGSTKISAASSFWWIYSFTEVSSLHFCEIGVGVAIFHLTDYIWLIINLKAQLKSIKNLN